MKTLRTEIEMFETLLNSYGEVLTYGGTPRLFFRGIRLAKELARVKGLYLDEVLTSIREWVTEED